MEIDVVSIEWNKIDKKTFLITELSALLVLVWKDACAQQWGLY